MPTSNMPIKLTATQNELRAEALELLREYQLAEVDVATPATINPFDILYGNSVSSKQLSQSKKSAGEARKKVTSKKTQKKAKEVAEKNKKKICAALKSVGDDTSLASIITAVIAGVGPAILSSAGVLVPAALVVAIALVIFRAGTAYYCADVTEVKNK